MVECSVATSGQQEQRGKARLASGLFKWSEIFRILSSFLEQHFGISGKNAIFNVVIVVSTLGHWL